MKKLAIGLLTLSVPLATSIRAQSPPQEPSAHLPLGVGPQRPIQEKPFKLGTFTQGGRTFVGLVLKDTTVIDVAASNAALEAGNPSLPKVAFPNEMKELIARYATGGLKERLYAIASQAPGSGTLDLKAVSVRPPLRPGLILNAAVNYTEHENEMARRSGATTAAPPAPQPKSIPGLWERKAGDTRHNPYLFLKAPNAVIAHGEAIRVPPGRDQIDWECEMTVIIGKTASRVPVEDAADYIFGYTLENDVSDRAARGDGRHGSDWLIGKSHDTFAPLGPFIVPREFIKDPQKLPIRFSLNGTLMQDSTTERMTHNVYELVAFASSILTLNPGDAIATGSSAGVGSARNPPIFMKAGDQAVCSVEGVGTLSNPVVGPAASTSSNAASR